MREPKPFLRKQTQSWYLKLGKEFINLGKDREEAFEQYHEIMAKRRTATAAAQDSVAYLMDLRWNWVKKHGAESTADRMKPVLRSFKHFVGPKLKVHKLRPFHVSNWLDGKFPHVSDTRRHTLITLIKTALSWAVDQGYIEASPIARMKKPEPAIRQEFIPANLWNDVLESATDQEFKDYLTVMLSAGARPQEIRQIEARHLDGKRLVFEIKESKGKRRNRIIWLPEDAFEIITRLARQYPEGKLFRNRKGAAWTRYTVRNRFRRLKKLLKMPKLTATVLRHSFAHHRLVSGQDNLVVSKLMGHVDGRMLATRYGHLEKNTQFMSEQANLIEFPSDQPEPAGQQDRRQAG
jgi:integrase